MCPSLKGCFREMVDAVVGLDVKIIPSKLIGQQLGNLSPSTPFLPIPSEQIRSMAVIGNANAMLMVVLMEAPNPPVQLVTKANRGPWRSLGKRFEVSLSRELDVNATFDGIDDCGFDF